jgi:hypothetical protein
MRVVLLPICFLTAVLAAEPAWATNIWTDSNALRKFLKIQNLEQADEMMGTYPSAASPQRKAIMRGLLDQYSVKVDTTPKIDFQEKLDILCTMYSGLILTERVYWVDCMTCDEAYRSGIAQPCE